MKTAGFVNDIPPETTESPPMLLELPTRQLSLTVIDEPITHIPAILALSPACIKFPRMDKFEPIL